MSRELPPKRIHIADIKSIIGRCDSMYALSKNNPYILRLKNYFRNILISMNDLKIKNPSNEPYFNSEKYPDFCKMWGEVLQLVDTIDLIEK
jgi:hypothetical protein